MIKTIGYAAQHSVSDLRPYHFERAEPNANEVQIDVLYCGVCHSDVHQVKNEWKNTLYPCLPGHEIIGRVVAAGGAVTKHKVGDLVGVGCMIDSCHHCENCNAGDEQYCMEGFLATYNGNQRNPEEKNHTYGGYSKTMVVREDFVLRIPGNLDPAAAAPLLCAGVTTYSPMKHWNIGAGHRVGVVGLGGLGHMAIKIAKARGAMVVAITTSEDKTGDAMKLGADLVIQSKEDVQMENNANTLDFILSTIPQPHDANPYIALLRTNGTLIVVGCIAPLKKATDLSKMIIDRKSLATSLIGSIAETQEILDFCGEHNIVSDIRLISIDQVNDAFASIDKGEVDFRYVIDMATLKSDATDESLLGKVGL